MNNSAILTIKNVKFSGYHFYINLNIWGDSQICISVPLINDGLLSIVIPKRIALSLEIIKLPLILYLHWKSFFQPKNVN